MMRRLFLATTIYAVAEVVARGIGFALIPVWARYLSVEDFGRLEILRTLPPLTLAIATLGLPTALMRFDGAEQVTSFRRLFGTSFFLQCVVSVVVFVIAAVAFSTIDSLETLVAERALVLKSVGAALLSGLALGPAGLMARRRRAGSAAILNILSPLLAAPLSLLLVLTMNRGIDGVLEGQLVAGIVVVLVTALFVLREADFLFMREDVVKLFSYGLPLLPHALAAQVLASSDRYLLSAAEGPDAVALYGAAYLFATALIVVNLAFHRAMIPPIYDALNQPDPAAWLRRLLPSTSLVSVAMTAAGLCLAPEIVRWLFPETYWGSTTLLPWLICAAGLHGLYVPFATILMGSDNTRSLSAITVVAAGVNVALTLALFPTWGGKGAAIATTCAYGLLLALTWSSARRVAVVRFGVRTLVTFVVFTVVAVTLSVSTELVPDSSARLAVKAAVVFWAAAAALLLSLGPRPLSWVSRFRRQRRGGREGT